MSFWTVNEQFYTQKTTAAEPQKKIHRFKQINFALVAQQVREAGGEEKELLSLKEFRRHFST